MRKIFRIFVLLGVLSLGVSACSTNSDSDIGTWYRGLGRVEAVDGDIENGFNVRLDNGSWLVINNSQSQAYRDLEDGERLEVYFTLLGDLEPEDGEKRYLAILNYYNKVLSKEPVLQSFIDEDYEHRQDSIGSDPIRVDAAAFGGRYLNIRFTVARRVNSNELHFINLVADDVEYSDGVMDVYLRHHGYTDVPSSGSGNFVYAWSIVSFDLTGLVPEGEEGVKIRLNWTEYRSGWNDTIEKFTDLGTFVPYKTSDVANSAMDANGMEWNNIE